MLWHAQQATGPFIDVVTVKAQNNILLLKIRLNDQQKIVEIWSAKDSQKDLQQSVALLQSGLEPLTIAYYGIASLRYLTLLIK